MDYEPVAKLTKDLALAARTLSDDEARFLVDAYYTMQDDRIRANAQVRALGENKEPNSILEWLAAQSQSLENQIKRALQKYADSTPVGAWAQSNYGIGPVLTAGLLAHIDIEQAPTVGHIWAFAGLDPTKVWEKKTKRPWNAKLKTLCWKIGESFVKVSGNPEAYYGQVYAKRKLLETERNDRFEFKDQAATKLANVKIGKDTDAYKAYIIGKLPPAHIHARAKRYAVKLFLAHLHEVWYKEHYKTAPPLPYPIAILGHAHVIPPPNN